MNRPSVWAALLVIPVLAVAAGCSRPDPATPESVGARPIADIESFDLEDRDAVVAAIEWSRE